MDNQAKEQVKVILGSAKQVICTMIGGISQSEFDMTVALLPQGWKWRDRTRHIVDGPNGMAVKRPNWQRVRVGTLTFGPTYYMFQWTHTDERVRHPRPKVRWFRGNTDHLHVEPDGSGFSFTMGTGHTLHYRPFGLQTETNKETA